MMLKESGYGNKAEIPIYCIRLYYSTTSQARRAGLTTYLYLEVVSMEIKNRFGTVTVSFPARFPTSEEEKQLYTVLMECLIEKKMSAQVSCNRQGDLEEMAEVFSAIRQRPTK